MEGTLEKERRSAAGGWLAGVVEAGANEPFFTPVGGWVVERGLPRLLSVSRTSGLHRPFFFLPLVPLVPSLSTLSRSFSFSVSVSRHVSLVSPPLSRFCPVPRSTLATLLFRDLVSAAAFLFFSPLPTYMLAFPRPPPRPPTSPLFRHPLRARFSGFSCAPFQPPAYPLRNRSTETCSGVAGTKEDATEGNGVAYEIRAI